MSLFNMYSQLIEFMLKLSSLIPSSASGIFVALIGYLISITNTISQKEHSKIPSGEAPK